MSSHLDEFYTANLIFDNCSISSTISHQMRNWIFYRLPSGTCSKYRSVYLSCSVCIQEELFSKFVPMFNNFYISYKFTTYQHFAYVNIYILWVLHLPGQLFQHLGRFCGIYDNVSWVFYRSIWQMVLNVDLFLHWLQFSHIQYIHFQHDVFVRDLPINTSR